MRFLDETVLDRFSDNASSHAIQVSTLSPEQLHSPLIRQSFTCPVDNSQESKKWHYMKVFPCNLTSDNTDVTGLQVLSILLSRGQSSPFYKNLVKTNLVQLLCPLQG